MLHEISNGEYYAGNYEEALEICRSLKASGRADLFRGQTVDWPKLTPTIFRVKGEEREIYHTELGEFFEWLNNVPQMHQYHNSEEQATAIAQHYGLATPFLDLTTESEIALTFAKREPSASTGNAVIYCFLERELSCVDGVELVKVTVENLWRLEAQSGLFLKYLREDIVDYVKSKAIKVILPGMVLKAADRERLYPKRKSSLEVVLDQWFYRRQLEEAINGLSKHVDQQVATRRQTYPGIFIRREIPELLPKWLGEDYRWVRPPAESVLITHQPIVFKAKLGYSKPRKDAEHLKQIIRPVIFEALTTRRLLKFDLKLSGAASRYSKGISQIANWAWDGMRILPYDLNEHVTAMANILTMLAHSSKNRARGFELPTALFGETQCIDVAPVGGHVESGFVSKSGLEEARTFLNGNGFTKYSLKKMSTDPNWLSNFITDPWLLFDFNSFRKIFIEQFVPSAINGYWLTDLEHHKGKLESMWSITFNPALLGYVSNFEYRLLSPLATERDVEHLILVNHDMGKDDIAETFLACMPQIAGGDGPFLLRFHGFDGDEREIWEIPEAVNIAKQIVEVGGISVLEVFPTMSAASGEEIGSPGAIGAFEVWLISKGLLRKVLGKHFDEFRPLWEEFWQVLLVSNGKIDRAYAQYNIEEIVDIGDESM